MSGIERDGGGRAGPRLSVLDEAARLALHAATLQVLERTGVTVKHAGARELCSQAGARVDGERVRIPGALVEQALKTAPRSWQLLRRGAAGPPLDLAQGNSYFGSGPDCPYVRDPRTGERRRAVLADVEAAARLSEALPNIDFVMSMGLPQDVAGEDLEIAQMAAMLGATSKPIVLSSPLGTDSLRRVIDLAERFDGGRQSLACLIMSSPPLTLDAVMIDRAVVCGEMKVPLILATAPSAGSTAPAALASVIVVANAETLATLVIHQLANPGAPFVYGVGCAVFDMRAMAEPYGRPDDMLGNQAQCELAAAYGLPTWSYAGHTDSKVLDEQWSLDSAVATLLGRLSGATLLHDVGYMEIGMQSSLEALVLGDELAGFARSFCAGVTVNDETLLLDEIDAAGPGGDHLARPHTRRHYRELWHSDLLDQRPHDRWLADGGSTLGQRVRTRTLALLDAPPAFVPDERARTALAEALGPLARSLRVHCGCMRPAAPAVFFSDRSTD